MAVTLRVDGSVHPMHMESMTDDMFERGSAVGR